MGKPDIFTKFTVGVGATAVIIGSVLPAYEPVFTASFELPPHAPSIVYLSTGSSSWSCDAYAVSDHREYIPGAASNAIKATLSFVTKAPTWVPPTVR